MSYTPNTTLLPQQIFLNSLFNTVSYNDTMKSDILFELEEPIIIPSNVDCFVQINTFKFFNTFYNVTESNNIFYYNATSVTIAPGNYSIKTFIATLNEALLDGNVYLVYDSLTFKISIVSVSGISLTLGLNNCFELIGISSDKSSSTLHVSDQLVNLAGVQILYLTFPNVHIKSNGVRNNVLNNVLEAVNINVPIGSAENYGNIHSTKYKVGENVITSINIKIYDEKLRLVDFNNTDWFLSLSVIFSYKNQHIMAPELLT
jgi:hypothetical protein